MRAARRLLAAAVLVGALSPSACRKKAAPPPAPPPRPALAAIALENMSPAGAESPAVDEPAIEGELRKALAASGLFAPGGSKSVTFAKPGKFAYYCQLHGDKGGVLMSDGKETVPSNPDNPKGAFTAARTARDQGVPISTVSFGTPYGYVEMNDQRTPVPVDDEMLKKIAQLSNGQAHTASNLEQLKEVFTNLQEQIGYETRKGDASAGWLRLGALVLALAALAALFINRRLPN